MRRSRPTGSGGSGVIVAAALVALLLTAHSCSGGAASLVSEMSGPAAGRRSGGRLDEMVLTRSGLTWCLGGVGGHVDWVCADSEPNQTALSDSIK